MLAFVPWLVLYVSVQALGPPRHPWFLGLAFERGWPVLEWTEILYASSYVFTPLAPLMAPTRAALRRFVVTGLIATFVVGVFWLALPVVAVRRPFVPETFWGRLLAEERSWPAHVAAFPSFHALWALIAVDALRLRSRVWEAVAWSWTALITMSCATTGQHAVLDLVAAALLFVPLRRAGAALSSPAAGAGPRQLCLHKWYLDCLTKDGDAAIVYLGRVTLGWLAVPYFELLAVGPGGRADGAGCPPAPRCCETDWPSSSRRRRSDLGGAGSRRSRPLRSRSSRPRGGRSAGAVTSRAARASCGCPTDAAWRVAATRKSWR